MRPKTHRLGRIVMSQASRTPDEAGHRPHLTMPKPAHYRGTYHVDSRNVRNAANANPHTRCRRCHQTAIPGDPWEAGHIRDGDPNSPLAPEHRSCNRSAGATHGNAMRAQQQQPQPPPPPTNTRWRWPKNN